jgi:uncharacterized membrane protein YhaH (DUF805 family)
LVFLTSKTIIMNFIEAIKSVFTNFANFNGRARRSEYWWFFLFSLIVRVPISLLLKSTAIDAVIGIGLLIPSIAVGVRRMHDVGKSGWFLLIPIYNLVLACTNGDSGTNEYGADPKGDALEEDINAIGHN